MSQDVIQHSSRAFPQTPQPFPKARTCTKYFPKKGTKNVVLHFTLSKRSLVFRLCVSALENHLLIKRCSHTLVVSYTPSLSQVYFEPATLLKRAATDATELHCKWPFKERRNCICVNYFYSYFSNTNGRQGLVFPQISF